MLRITHQHSLLSCSKGARGLSVLPRVTGVFTGTTNSQCPSLRQRPDRCAIRAGRNLPDKEFRYLRTVIVTAAVYRGFNSELHLLKRLTPPFNLPAPGRRQTLYVVFDLAESCVFSKQSPGPLYCNSFPLTEQVGSRAGAPLLPKLRGEFAEFLNEGSHSRLRIFSSPTCVGLRYGYQNDSLEAFLGSVASPTLRPYGLAIAPQGMRTTGFSWRLPLHA